jgi:hypothetical protein
VAAAATAVSDTGLLAVKTLQMEHEVARLTEASAMLQAMHYI